MNTRFRNVSAAFFTFLISVLLVALVFFDNSIEITQDVRESISARSVEEINEEFIEGESYEVYSALIKDTQTSDNFGLFVKNFRFLVIGKETIDCGANDVQEGIKDLRKSSEKYAVNELNISDDLLENYHESNKQCIQLKEKFNIPVKYLLVSESELENFFSDQNSYGWDKFYKKYPDSSGIIGLSKVGFNKDIKKAFLYVTRSCGGKCGAGYYVLLEKKGNIWEVKSTSNVWVS